MKYLILICIFFISVFHLHGQSEGGIGLYFSTGKVIKHRESFVIDPSIEQSWQFGIRFQSRNYHPDYWRKSSGYPAFTLDLLYSHFGVNDIYGEAISFFPGLTFYISRLYIKTGLGVAYLSKPYDDQADLPNTAIGSNLNALAQLHLGWQVPVHRWKFFLEGGITHFSNVGITKPNLGLNYLGITSGVRYNFSGNSPAKGRDDAVPRVQRFQWGLKYSFGYFDYERISADELNQYSWAQSMAIKAAYRNGIHQPFITMKYTRNKAQELRNNQENIRTLSISIGNEFRLGPVGAFFVAGIYLRKNYTTPYPIPSEFGINYYFNQGFYIGMNMKNHLIVAEYPELSLGAWF